MLCVVNCLCVVVVIVGVGFLGYVWLVGDIEGVGVVVGVWIGFKYFVGDLCCVW